MTGKFKSTTDNHQRSTEVQTPRQTRACHIWNILQYSFGKLPSFQAYTNFKAFGWCFFGNHATHRSVMATPLGTQKCPDFPTRR
jgi:hypothetical protein